VHEVWKDDLARLCVRCHLVPVLTRPHDEFKPPESIGGQTEPAAYGWALWIAQEAKVYREEKIIDILWGVAQRPQGKRGMRLLRW
jgi:hypothetical protein